jgi:hypothetical protein
MAFEKENWVARISAANRAVADTMYAPVRLKLPIRTPAMTSPTAPPARTGSPS